MNSPVVRGHRVSPPRSGRSPMAAKAFATSEEMASEQADVFSIAAGRKLAKREHGEAPDEAIRVRSDGQSPT